MPEDCKERVSVSVLSPVDATCWRSGDGSSRLSQDSRKDL